MDAKLCVKMNQKQQTIIKDVEEGDKYGQEKTFTFDHSFWSHDAFETKDGVSVPKGEDSPYADQDLLYQKLGKQVLDNAWSGYHCCLFAYGQTGAGKSYSMVGYGANKGIVPISCEEIFIRIAKNTDKHLE